MNELSWFFGICFRGHIIDARNVGTALTSYFCQAIWSVIPDVRTTKERLFNKACEPRFVILWELWHSSPSTSQPRLCSPFAADLPLSAVPASPSALNDRAAQQWPRREHNTAISNERANSAKLSSPR